MGLGCALFGSHLIVVIDTYTPMTVVGLSQARMCYPATIQTVWVIAPFRFRYNADPPTAPAPVVVDIPITNSVEVAHGASSAFAQDGFRGFSVCETTTGIHDAAVVRNHV